jgi:membrane-bound lytic murein transglycosylase D
MPDRLHQGTKEGPMNRWWIIAWLSLSVGCGTGRSRVAGPPAPADSAALARRPDTTPPSAETVLPPAPLLDIARAVHDTALLRALSRDSLLDAEMLERLHDVTAAGPSNGTEAEVDLEEMFDINVARYADHARVRFYLDFFQGPARERMAVWLARLPHYEPIIRSVFQARGLPSDLVYLALIESGYSNTAVSRSKAVGMWQFMRATAAGFGLTVDRWVDERRDFLKATNAAAQYLSELTKRFNGSHYLAAAAYNGGAGTVSRGLKRIPVESAAEEDEEAEVDSAEAVEDDRFFQLSDSRYLRKETKDYVPKLIAAAMIAKQPEKYGFPPIPKVEPYAVDSVPVTDAASLEVIARVSDTPLAELSALNPHLLRGITPPGRLTWVRVPNGKGVTATEALAAIPPAERVPALLHAVGRRETVGSIARRYRVTEREIRALNPGLGSGALAVGSTVRIPGTVRVQRLVTDDQRQPERRGSVHRVRPGETLSSIAEHYRTTTAHLAAMNGISRHAKLRVGQRLVVGRSSAVHRASSGPAASRQERTAAAGGTHVVRRGETLTALARRYGVTVQALMAANGLRSPSELKAGRRLNIPS